MTVKRIIPCLDTKNGRVVKGRKFDDLKDVENPIELAKFYNQSGADELVFYDITASVENRSLFTELLRSVASEVTIPLTAGGGINTIFDIENVLSCGADKVSINSGAIKNPKFIEEAAKKFGTERIVFAMDVKRVGEKFMVFCKGGKENTGIDAIMWAVRGQDSGAGEIVVNSIDTDGVKNGFDLDLLKAISDKVSIPIVASGGAGKIQDFVELFKTLPQIDAGLAASVFHFKEVIIKNLKEQLRINGVSVNL